MSNANKTIKIMVYIALYTAIAIGLDIFKEMISFLDLPQGGSINIALIPIVLSSFHLGPIFGMATGTLWMAISFLITPPYIAPNMAILGFVCDYIIPSIVIGASSVFFIKKKNYIMMELGIIATMVIRTLSILLSGAYAWPGDEAAGSFAAWTGSLTYNLPYCVATTILLVIIIPLIYKVLKRQISKND